MILELVRYVYEDYLTLEKSHHEGHVRQYETLVKQIVVYKYKKKNSDQVNFVNRKSK